MSASSVRVLATLTVVLACTPVCTAHAQNAGLPRRDNPVLFLEKAYFALLSPIGKDYLFEGQPSAHYFLTNGFNDRRWLRDGGWKWAAPVSATFLVRMVDTTSQPVRTPSYQIRPIYVQFAHARRRDPDDMNAFRIFGIGAGFTHFSNGQAGCTFRGFVRDSVGKDAPCRVADSALARQHLVNAVDGDFSTTFFSTATHWRRGRVRIDARDSIGLVHWQHTVGLEIQLHPINIRPGGINGPQSLDYGQHQLGVSYEGERRFCETPERHRLCGVTRIALAGSHRFRRTGGASRQFATLEASWLFDRARAFGAFVRFTQGSDYYNIRYQREGPLVLAGVMWDIGRADLHHRGGRTGTMIAATDSATTDDTP